MKSTLDDKKIPSKNIFFFRQRLKNKIFQSTLAYFAGVAKERNLTKKDIANLLDKDPAQITRWFSGPNNWTLDTISDLLLAMDAELKHEIVPVHEIRQQSTNTNSITGLSVESGTSLFEVSTVYEGEILQSENEHSLTEIKKNSKSGQPKSSVSSGLKFSESFLGSNGQKNRAQTAERSLQTFPQTQVNPKTLSGSIAIH